MIVHDEHEEDDLNDDEIRILLKSMMGSLEVEIANETQRASNAVEAKPRSWIDSLGAKKR